MNPHPIPTFPHAPFTQPPSSQGKEITDGVYVSDALDIMGALQDGSVDLLLTDIPYAHVSRPSGGLRNLDKGFADTETFSLLKFAEQALRVVSGNGVVFCGKEQFSPLFEYFAKDCSTRMVVWEKTNPMPMNGQYLFLSGVECAVFFRKSGATFNGHCQNTVFRYPNGSSRVHPTEKPLKLFKELVTLLSDPGELILDPCVGSGTTAVACMELERRYIVSDISKESIEVTRGRLARAKPCLINSSNGIER